ncbi:malate dehydrogenase [Starmerella bacillaris]|uniref:Malate dehydrogenase n=1 Tax=Starmerella bacillaris TaxID=1247836 RepID=A0AAV5RHG0_STABA|nr:malate dehydrogenase [Starmerella bacillaris]
MVKVVVIGAAGGIGQPLSMLLKMSPLIDELALYDVVNSIGVAADLSHVSSVSSVTGYLPVNNGLEQALSNADVVLIPAGMARKPGMTRDDLFKINAGIVANITQSIAKKAPQALVLLISNPINSTVPVAVEVMKRYGVFDARRLFGVTTLDTVRARTFIGQLTHTNPREVSVPVIGGHSGVTIVPLLSQSKPSTACLSEEERENLIHRVRFGGDEIVQAKAGAGSATLSMAYAAFRFAEIVLEGYEGEDSSSTSFVYLPGIPGGQELAQKLDVEYLSVPMLFGPNGAIKVVNMLDKLTPEELDMLNVAIDGVKDNVKKAMEFVNQYFEEHSM